MTQKAFPGIKGFNRRGLYRMKQFYETYADFEKVSPLVTQISWTNNLLSMSPMLVSEYKLQLPDKKVLREKLQELVNISEIGEVNHDDIRCD